MKSSLIKSASAFVLALALSAASYALPITGGISFGGQITPNTGNLNTATSVSFGAVAVLDTAGTFATVPIFTPTTFNPLAFNPFPGGGIQPLWTVMGFSFDLNALTQILQLGNNALEIRGTGIFKNAAYDDTNGTFIFTANQGGGTFSWSASNAAVPDSGTTVALLGAALVAMGLISRRRV